MSHAQCPLKRDAIHDNQLGQQVLARGLDAYFAAGAVPEPAVLPLAAMAALALLRRKR